MDFGTVLTLSTQCLVGYILNKTCPNLAKLETAVTVSVPLLHDSSKKNYL